MTNLCLNSSEAHVEGCKASTTGEEKDAFLMHHIDRAFSPRDQLRIDYLARWARLVSRCALGAEEGEWILVGICSLLSQAHQRCNTIAAQSNGLGKQDPPEKKPRVPCMGSSEKRENSCMLGGPF